MSDAFRLSAQPRGVLDLFQSRQSGAYPDNMAGFYQLVVDVTEFTAVIQNNVSSGSLVVSATGFALFVNTPPGKLRRWTKLCQQIPTNAANFVRGFIAARYDASTLIQLSQVLDSSVVTDATVFDFVSSGLPLWLPPGAQLGFQCTKVGGTGATVTLNGVFNEWAN